MKHLQRNIASIILLASYLPMATLSSFHVHDDTIDAQDGCGQCVGHFENPHHHHHDCPYCIFLGLNYIVQQTFWIVPLWESVTKLQLADVTNISYCYGTSLLRAPPVA